MDLPDTSFVPDTCTLPTAQRPVRVAARETACCSFFTFTVDAVPPGLVLTVDVPVARADVLGGLHRLAATALGPG